MEENHQMQMKSPKNLKEEEKLLGIGGWLVIVQIMMALAFIILFANLERNIQARALTKIVVLLAFIALNILCIVQFYRNRKIFRILLLCHTAVSILYFYSLSDFAERGRSDIFIMFCFALVTACVLFLFISKRVRYTFCVQGRQKLKRIKQQNPPTGINGWLLLIQILLIAYTSSAFFGIDYLVYYFEKAEILFILLYIAYLAVASLCMVLFYRKKRIFRIFYIFVSVIFLVVPNNSFITDIVSIDTWPRTLLGIAIHTLIVLALFKSERVKNTFS